MGSQTDLDQGGTSRQWVRTYMGPTVGWVMLPGRNGLFIGTAGTYQLQPDTSQVAVFCAGLVTIKLPTCLYPSVPASTQPALFSDLAINITDIGGFATAFPITIQPFSVAETIMGLAQVQITSAFGSFILSPVNATAKWINSVQ